MRRTSARSSRFSTRARKAKRCSTIQTRRSPPCWPAFPDAETVTLHPADVPFFVTLCKTPGKPVNFVPVIDKDVRRWWRSDSLWQAHDARYTADQVCIIPGTQAVAGITRVDEPVGELLDRFEQEITDRVLGSGAEPVPVVSRRQARADVAGPLAVVLDSPDVLWAGRTSINPVHRIGEPSEWQVNDVPGKPSATHPSTGARLELAGRIGLRVTLSVPLSDIWIDIRFTLPSCTVDGGMPIVTVEDAAKAMRAVLAIAAGVEGPDSLPPVENNTATVTVEWDPEKVADHTGVTATFGAPLAPGLTLVPDALVGLCWPAVFSAIGSALTDDGFPVVEGLLSLVHLDHAAHLLQAMPTVKSELTVTATASAATDTEVGRVVPVTVTITEAGREDGAGAGHPGGALRDPRPHRCARADRSASCRGCHHRQRHRYAAPQAPRRHGHRAGRHERVRGGLRRPQPDPHRPGGRAARRSENARSCTACGSLRRLSMPSPPPTAAPPRRPGWWAGRPGSSGWCCPATRSNSGWTASASTAAPRSSRSRPASAPTL